MILLKISRIFYNQIAIIHEYSWKAKFYKGRDFGIVKASIRHVFESLQMMPDSELTLWSWGLKDVCVFEIVMENP